MPGPCVPFPSTGDEPRSALRFLGTAPNASRHATRRHHVAKAIEHLAGSHCLPGCLETQDQDAASGLNAA